MTKQFAAVPMKSIGPILIKNLELNSKTEVRVPMATFETTLWPSTARGAKLSRLCGGIDSIILSDNMARAIAVEAPSSRYGYQVIEHLKERQEDIALIIQGSSRFAKFDALTTRLIGNTIYLRLAIHPGDASGHNMVTKSADALMQWLLNEYQELRYLSVSSNWCTDKKVSAVNGLLGRGLHVVNELVIPRDICQKHLRTTPEKIHALHIKKNLTGSIISGGLLSANAHFANMLLATYLATGQDAANIVEGSQGITHVDLLADGSLHFSVNLPNIIVGTVGNGKHHEFVTENLTLLGCNNPEAPAGANRRRLAMIIGATVLCGELSLMAALTNPGELMHSHVVFERDQRHTISGNN
ncbi:hydroxymethylglutaryl-CoA reductase [Piscirickettsia salmonis]|uniref:hydroxymethylglutaryl-CoA reductase n=1 Tax=Piscirickettsia salmonis TaxID=1238 RepID=UPI0007D7C461|nr:Hydroxymethylglutaryl-coenzyme A reductase [Piscirickettsiaceae bacterium NZ-RLO1]